MLWLSEIMLEHYQLESFEQLIEVVERKAKQGERFLRMDLKPGYPDTPANWEDRLEAAFTRAIDPHE